MADFIDKNTGKQYVKNSFTALSASIASNPILDGRKHEFISESEAVAKLPFRITNGDQAKFFPGLEKGTSHGRIETGSIIRDTVRKIVYVPIKKENYLLNMIGPNSFVSSTFASGAYLKVSASFASKFRSVGDDVLFTYCVEEFYSASADSGSKSLNNVGPLVAEFDIFKSGSTTSSFSAIDTASIGSPDFEFSFPSENFISHWDFRFDNLGKPSIFYSSSIYVSSAFARFAPGVSDNPKNTGSFNLGVDLGSGIVDNQFVDPSSGSLIGHGIMQNINGINTSDGRFVEFLFKSRLSGDADSGSLYQQFPGLGQLIVYTKHMADSFSSASFQYNSSSRDAATGSSEIKTLFFYSGSGASSSASADYGFYITGGIPTAGVPNSTPLHTDATFRHNAEAGFYSPSGSAFSSSIQVQTASGVTSGKGPVFAQLYNAG